MKENMVLFEDHALGMRTREADRRRKNCFCNAGRERIDIRGRAKGTLGEEAEPEGVQKMSFC